MLGLEVALRTSPATFIPLGLLKRFRSEPRLEIAQRMGLNHQWQYRELARDDDGPALWLPEPYTPVSFPSSQGTRSVRMDDQGFCNPPRDSYQREGIDLLALGDSFTACVVLDAGQTWPSQLGLQTGLSVYNLGRAGVGLHEHLQILKRFGLAKRPRFAVLNFYEGNDLRDAQRYQEVAATRRAGGNSLAVAHDRDEAAFDYQAVLDHAIGRRSYAANLVVVGLGEGYASLRKLVGRLAVDGPDDPAVEFRYDLRFDGVRIPFNVDNDDASEVRSARMLREGGISLAAVDDALERYEALSRDHEFTPILAYSPSAYSAYADFVEFRDPALAELMPWFHAEQLAYLAGRARELGLVFIDLTPPLQRAARARQQRDLLYDPLNVHYTASANRVVAEELARVVADSDGRRR
jgi:hypothetical protein